MSVTSRGVTTVILAITCVDSALSRQGGHWVVLACGPNQGYLKTSTMGQFVQRENRKKRPGNEPVRVVL